MEATPDVYRADIAHTHEHIARIDAGDWQGETAEQAELRRWRLIGQVENLQRSLARAEVLWAEAEAQGPIWTPTMVRKLRRGMTIQHSGRCERRVAYVQRTPAGFLVGLVHPELERTIAYAYQGHETFLAHR